MEFRTARHAARGFTLIELMIVVVIGTILLGIAVPSYMSQIRKSRRTEARTALLDLAGREERYFSTSVNGANYSANPADLGLAGAWPVVVGSGYYNVTVTACAVGANCGPNGIPGPSFVIVANPVAGQTQVNDVECTSFSVDSVGSQFATGSQTIPYCWGN